MERPPVRSACPTFRLLRNSGFGTYSASATSAKVILSPNADSNVPFLYVVVRDSDWFLLDVRVDGQTARRRWHVPNLH